MPLANDLALEIVKGELNPTWTTTDLENNSTLRGAWPINTLRSAPYSSSISLRGLELGGGANANPNDPTYFRVGRRGRAIQFSLPLHVNPVAMNPPAPAQPPAENEVEPDDTTVEAIVEDEGPSSTEPTVLQPAPLSPLAIDAIREMVFQVQTDSPWNVRLNEYLWRGRSFYQTQGDLADIIWRGSAFCRLILAGAKWTSGDNHAAEQWASEIFEWGGTRQKREITGKKIHDTLVNALENRVVCASAPMNSGYTKVASFGTAFRKEAEFAEYSGTAQVINDSRVAASLTYRLDGILSGNHIYEKYDPSDLFPCLGRVDAARSGGGGTRPRRLKNNWPSAYQSWLGQFAATQVVAQICDVLNTSENLPKMPDRNDNDVLWTLRGVEAVLFMDGY